MTLLVRLSHWLLAHVPPRRVTHPPAAIDRSGRPGYTEPGDGLMTPMENRLPTGPGSRGGQWHDPEYRRAYHRAWRAAHPDYRDRERLRRQRARVAMSEPADIGSTPTYPRPLPLAGVHCVCECGCPESVVVVCGWCRDGIHQEDAS